MSFTAITNGVDSLVVTVPPTILDRFGDRGKPSTSATGLTSQPIVVEYQYDAPAARLALRFALLTWAQAETIADMMDDGGLLTVRLYDGASTFSATFAPRSEQAIEPFFDNDHPERDRNGNVLDTRLTAYRADLTLIRLS